jgi:hypothetical protein
VLRFGPGRAVCNLMEWPHLANDDGVRRCNLSQCRGCFLVVGVDADHHNELTIGHGDADRRDTRMAPIEEQTLLKYLVLALDLTVGARSALHADVLGERQSPTQPHEMLFEVSSEQNDQPSVIAIDAAVVRGVPSAVVVHDLAFVNELHAGKNAAQKAVAEAPEN